MFKPLQHTYIFIKPYLGFILGPNEISHYHTFKRLFFAVFLGMFKPLQHALHEREETYASGTLLRPYPVGVFDDISEKNKTIGVLLVSG